MYNIHLLPAAYGDAILIEYGSVTKPLYILIDGGPYYNYEEMLAGLKRVAPRVKTLELLVLTHIDIDHIDGTVTLLNNKKLPFVIKDVWFNGYDQLEGFGGVLGALQGEYISELIKEKKLPHNKSFKGGAVYVKDFKKLPVISFQGGMSLMLVGPGKGALEKLHATWKKEIKKYGKNPDFAKMLDKDSRYTPDSSILGDTPIEELQEVKINGDHAVPNGSTIAFIATYKGKSCLFAGDAPSDSLLMALDPMLAKSKDKRLQLDAWKLAHHGSKKSTLDKLMTKIACKKILVSTNGAKFHHPDEETIAKLIKNNGPGLQLYFNYKTEYNERWADAALQKTYKFKCWYPKKEGQPGMTLKLV